jgi:hypothetical protein
MRCREERKRRRAKKKRTAKAKEAAAAEASAQKAAAEGGAAAVAGRKSYQARMAAAVSSGLVKKGLVAGKHGKAEFGKSTAAFAKIQETRDAGALGKKAAAGKKEAIAGAAAVMKGNALKL